MKDDVRVGKGEETSKSDESEYGTRSPGVLVTTRYLQSGRDGKGPYRVRKKVQKHVDNERFTPN